MLISQRNAQMIVEEMEKTIHKNINIMDETGRIVASTDPGRIHKYHEGAIQVIEQSLHELVIEDDDCFQGARHGINFPIVINDEIIGVVGITGEYEEVAIFGTIIQKMTQILIRDMYEQEQKLKRENERSLFLQEWLFSATASEEHGFSLRGKKLGIDIYRTHIVAVLQPSKRGKQPSTTSLQQNMYEHVQREIQYNAQHLLLGMASRNIVLFCSERYESILPILYSIQDKVQQEHGVTLHCGVSVPCNVFSEIPRALKEAEQACQYPRSVQHERPNIRFYEDLDMEILFSSIPYRERARFVNRVFGKWTAEERREWIHLLEIFFANNSSINQSADALFIHKNTLQYRLKKIKKETGYDPRIMHEAVPLHIATLLYEEENSDEE